MSVPANVVNNYLVGGFELMPLHKQFFVGNMDVLDGSVRVFERGHVHVPWRRMERADAL